MSSDASPDIVQAIKRLVISESRLSIGTEEIRDDELLNGPILSVTSLGFLGMLVKLEDELNLELPDDLFVGREFTTVADIVDTVATTRSTQATSSEAK